MSLYVSAHDLHVVNDAVDVHFEVVDAARGKPPRIIFIGGRFVVRRPGHDVSIRRCAGVVESVVFGAETADKKLL